MCRSQGRESLVQNGGLLWVVKSGWNVVQGPGSVGVSHEAGGPCGQELTYQCWGAQNIRLNPQRDCLRGLDALTKRTPGTTNQLPSPLSGWQSRRSHLKGSAPAWFKKQTQ